MQIPMKFKAYTSIHLNIMMHYQLVNKMCAIISYKSTHLRILQKTLNSLFKLKKTLTWIFIYMEDKIDKMYHKI